MKELKDRGYEEDRGNEPAKNEERGRAGIKFSQNGRRYFRNRVYPTQRFQKEIDEIYYGTERADPPAEEAS